MFKLLAIRARNSASRAKNPRFKVLVIELQVSYLSNILALYTYNIS